MIAIPSRSQKKRWWRKDESLGGLIVQRFLLTHRNYASQVPFSYFCSTPESSAQVARRGHIFSAVPLLKEMCSGNNNYKLPNRYRANEALMA